MARLEVVPFPLRGIRNFFAPTHEQRNDAHPQAAPAAPLLGGPGIFDGAVARGSGLATSFVVGNRGAGFRPGRVVVCAEASLDGEIALFGYMDPVGSFSDSGARW